MKSPKAYAISQRSGMKFLISEMIREPDTGLFIHRSESDGKYNAVGHPQANLAQYSPKFDDPKSTPNARPDRDWAAAQVFQGACETGGSVYLMASATRGLFGTASISASASFTGAGELKEVHFGDVDIVGSGVLSAAVIKQYNMSSSITAAGTVAGVALTHFRGVTSISAAGTVTSTGAISKYGISSITGTCSLTSSAVILVIHNGVASISGAATVTSSTSLGHRGVATSSSSATVASAGKRLLRGVATSTASGTASVDSALLTKTRLIYSFEDTPPAIDYSTKMTSASGVEAMARLLNADTTMTLTRTTDNKTNGTYTWRALHVESGGTTNTATILVADSLTVGTVNPSTGFDLTGYTVAKLDYYVASASGDDGVTIRFVAVSDVSRSSVTGDLAGTTGAGTLSVSLTGAFDESNVKFQITVTADDDAGGATGSGFDIYFDNLRAE